MQRGRSQGLEGWGGQDVVQGGAGATGKGAKCGQGSGKASCHAVASVGSDPGIKKRVF